MKYVAISAAVIMATSSAALAVGRSPPVTSSAAFEATNSPPAVTRIDCVDSDGDQSGFCDYPPYGCYVKCDFRPGPYAVSYYTRAQDDDYRVVQQ